MIGWKLIANYSPVYSSIFGLVYFIFFFNLGNIAKKFILKISTDNSFNFYTSLILGYLIVR